MNIFPQNPQRHVQSIPFTVHLGGVVVCLSVVVVYPATPAVSIAASDYAGVVAGRVETAVFFCVLVSE